MPHSRSDDARKRRTLRAIAFGFVSSHAVKTNGSKQDWSIDATELSVSLIANHGGATSCRDSWDDISDTSFESCSNFDP